MGMLASSNPRKIAYSSAAGSLSSPCVRYTPVVTDWHLSPVTVWAGAQSISSFAAREYRVSVPNARRTSASRITNKKTRYALATSTRLDVKSCTMKLTDRTGWLQHRRQRAAICDDGPGRSEDLEKAPGGLSLRTLQRRTHACYRGFAIDGSSIDALHTQRQTVTRCGLQPVRPKWCSSVLQRAAASGSRGAAAEAHPEPPEGTSGLYADLLRVAEPTPVLPGPSSCDRVISLCGASHARHQVNVSSTRAKVDRMPRG